MNGTLYTLSWEGDFYPCIMRILILMRHPCEGRTSVQGVARAHGPFAQAQHFCQAFMRGAVVSLSSCQRGNVYRVAKRTWLPSLKSGAHRQAQASSPLHSLIKLYDHWLAIARAPCSEQTFCQF